MTCHFMLKKIKKNNVEWATEAEIQKVEFLAAGEESMAILWLTSSFEERTFDSLWFSAKGTLFSVWSTDPTTGLEDVP